MIIYANNGLSILSLLNRKRRQYSELRQTVRDIYNSGYECGAAESRNSRCSLEKEGRSIEDKPGIKERIGNRNGEWISREKESKMETKEGRKGMSASAVWRSKCVWEASNFFLYPSNSIRVVAFPLSTLVFIAHGVNTLPRIVRRNFLVIRNWKQSFSRENDSFVDIVIV